MSGVAQWVKKNINAVVLLAIIGMGILLMLFTLFISVRLPMTDIFVTVFLATYLGYRLFLTGVKFYSPLALTETEIFTTFEGRVEAVWDEEKRMYLTLVFVEGYNSPRRAFSKPDISSGRTTLLLVASPFMVGCMASGRYLIVYGTPLRAGAAEARALLKRKSIQRAIGQEVRAIDALYVVSNSRSLEPDTLPEDVAGMREFGELIGRWQSDLEESVSKFSEDFTRKLRGVMNLRRTRHLEEEAIVRAREERDREQRKEG